MANVRTQHNGWRLFMLALAAVLSLSLLASCEAQSQPAQSQPLTAPAAIPPTPVSTPTDEEEMPTWTPLPLETTPIPTIDVGSFQATVEAVMATLPTMTPYPGAPPDQKTMDQQWKDLYVEAAATVAAIQHIRPILAPQPTPVPPLTPWPGPPTQVAGDGVIVGTNLCGEKLIGTKNVWRETKGTLVVGVCVGNTYFRPYRGEVLVEVFDTSINSVVQGPDLYPVPGQTSWVKVIDAVGERLTLQADTGDLFYFDVTTRQWVSP